MFDVELLPSVVDSAYHPEIIAAYVDHDPIHCGSRLKQVDTVRTEKLLQVRESFRACHLQNAVATIKPGLVVRVQNRSVVKT
ncbi:hypothetical protein D3C72_2445920 [compost metagenome]